ncbi:MAG TPA: ATP-binding protein [Pyrinomonadaceae bacterium]|nr:ATP-binding protein [Pyrinomonadaceae bacterium]
MESELLPQSLFLKIFLWFVAVMITVIAGTFIVGEITRHEPFRPPPGPIEATVKTFGETASETYEREGQSALGAYLDRIQNETGIRIFLFNDQAQSLSNHRMPPVAIEAAQRALSITQTDPVMAPPFMARSITTQRGGRYAVVAELPMRKRSGPVGHFTEGILHMIGVSIVGALFCYWLARYLTSPVTKLRAATQQLAQGNLSARVGPAIGNRRDELAYLGADFDLMAEQIESLINSQRRLLGDISHELRSPLARLNVALELAVQRAGPDAAGALARIQREAENLNEMIGQLLALTRLESRTEGFQKTELDLRQLVGEIVDDADFEARGRNRSVRFEANEECMVMGIEQLLRRAIENVVRNAVQYTPEGTEVEVTLLRDSCDGLESAAKSDRDSESLNCAVVTVRDRGAGVPESALTKIFHPFYRVDEARDREAGGVGLGLAIAERAVRLHGGRVAATNADGGGLVVTISLPVEDS